MPSSHHAVRADACALPIAGESVDLIVTSPPYFGIRDYGSDAEIGSEPTVSGFVSALLAAAAEMKRVLTRKGSIFVNLGDTYAAYNANRGDGRLQTNGGQSRPSAPRGLSGGGQVPNKSLMLVPERFRIGCADQLGLTVRSVIVWRKISPMPGGRIRDRVRTVHEDWVHLTRTDRYFYDESALREMGAGQMPPSVWDGPTARRADHDHPASFHPSWPARFIRGWSAPGAVVLDPFGGSGTTARVAREMGRVGISVDLSMRWSRESLRD